MAAAGGAHALVVAYSEALAEADAGFLFHAPDNVIREFPQFTALDTYEELSAHLLAAIA